MSSCDTIGHDGVAVGVASGDATMLGVDDATIFRGSGVYTL